jgi:hypothetical protein
MRSGMSGWSRNRQLGQERKNFAPCQKNSQKPWVKDPGLVERDYPKLKWIVH